jgi:HEAT repeat protein
MEQPAERALEALGSAEAAVRVQGLMSIAEHRLQVPVERLHRALTDADASVRAAAAFALSKVGGTSSIEPLHAAWSLSGPAEPHLRRQLLIALGEVGGAAALEKVLDGFAAWHSDLQELVIDFLDSGREVAAPALLRRLLAEPLDPETHERVADALARRA